MIRLTYRLHETTEKNLQIYCEKEFGCTLEKKLDAVIKKWLSKAIEAIKKHKG